MKTSIQRIAAPPPLDVDDDVIDSVAEARTSLGQALARLTHTIARTEILIGELAAAHSQRKGRFGWHQSLDD